VEGGTPLEDGSESGRLDEKKLYRGWQETPPRHQRQGAPGNLSLAAYGFTRSNARKHALRPVGRTTTRVLDVKLSQKGSHSKKETSGG